MNKHAQARSKAVLRWRLLATASVMVLAGFAGMDARAGEATSPFSDHPTLWLELGGNFVQIRGQSEPWIPPVRGAFTGDAAGIRKDPSTGFGGEAKLTLRPNDDDWVFSLGVVYGRALRGDKMHETQQPTGTYRHLVKFYDAIGRQSENHMIIDFRAEKDFGLGSRGGKSAFGAGFKIAQFDMGEGEFVTSSPHSTAFHRYQYHDHATIDRNTAAIGPAISWDASLPVTGAQDKGLSLDWSAGAALLFGRQKYDIRKRAEIEIVAAVFPDSHTTTITTNSRQKNGTIPNVGGSLGVSYHWSAAKMSLGYRADWYFNAMDGGVAARQNLNRGFFGPYFNIAVGFGGD